MDFPSNKIVNIGDRFLFFPGHTEPDVWTSVVVSMEEASALQNQRYGGAGSPSELAAHRRALPEKSAYLVINEDLCLGVCSENCFFPFRVAVPVKPGETPAIKIWHVEVFVSGDLLSYAVVIGCPGQASCNFCFGRQSAATFKEVAADPSKPCVLRTQESQAEDLAEFLAQTGKHPTPVNGVSQKALLPLSYELVVPPYLHVCILGPVNDILKSIKKVFLPLLIPAPRINKNALSFLGPDGAGRL